MSPFLIIHELKIVQMMTTFVFCNSKQQQTEILTAQESSQHNRKVSTQTPRLHPQDSDPAASPMERLRLVTLDMVGTVIRFRQPPAQQYQAAAARSAECHHDIMAL